MQMRIAFEPLVRLPERVVSLEPLQQLTTMKSLALHDAVFARKPWMLTELTPLTQLKELELAYDTALWAPGECRYVVSLHTHRLCKAKHVLDSFAQLVNQCTKSSCQRCVPDVPPAGTQC